MSSRNLDYEKEISVQQLLTKLQEVFTWIYGPTTEEAEDVLLPESRV